MMCHYLNVHFQGQRVKGTELDGGGWSAPRPYRCTAGYDPVPIVPEGGWSAPRPYRCTAGYDPVPIVQEGGWAPGLVWTGAEYLAPHPDSIPGPSRT